MSDAGDLEFDVVSARSDLITAAIVLLSVASAAAEPAVVGSTLNLRAGPGAAFNVIAKLPAGTRLDVQNCGEEWCRVAVGRSSGYVNRALLRIGADSYASAAPHPAPVEPKATLTGPTIWQWRDSEWRDRHWRQLDWHNRLNHN